MAWFQWISLRPLPSAWDLRRCGWRQAVDAGEAKGGAVALLLDGRTAHLAPDELAIALRPLVLVLGLADSTARARWLQMGYADALPAELEIDELDQRAARAIASRSISSSRRIGRLRLDLLARDAQVEGSRLRLHPREFALLWRLAEVPGALVNRATLLRDVFELEFDPGTNRLAVHVCRLRKKLARAGFASLLATAPGESAYRLDVNASARVQWDERGDPPQRIPIDPLFGFDPVIPLDPPGRLGEHARSIEELAR
jgi:two-component system, OmpR family, response regulator